MTGAAHLRSPLFCTQRQCSTIRVIASTDALFALSGLFNVVLFALTRPGLIPRNRSCAAHSALQARATSAKRIERHLSGDGIDFIADGIDTVERNRPN